MGCWSPIEGRELLFLPGSPWGRGGCPVRLVVYRDSSNKSIF